MTTQMANTEPTEIMSLLRALRVGFDSVIADAFDGDLTAETRIARAIHLSHAARAELGISVRQRTQRSEGSVTVSTLNFL